FGIVRDHREKPNSAARAVVETEECAEAADCFGPVSGTKSIEIEGDSHRSVKTDRRREKVSASHVQSGRSDSTHAILENEVPGAARLLRIGEPKLNAALGDSLDEATVAGVFVSRNLPFQDEYRFNVRGRGYGLRVHAIVLED